MGTYTIHPAADLFPMIEGKEFDDLVADIKANGLNHPIELLGNEVLDGRNRLAACEVAGVTPHYREIVTSDPVGYVMSANLHRRHLTTRQRAAIAADAATMKLGENQHTGQKEGGSNEPPSLSINEAAQKMGVSPASVKRAKKVKKEDPAAHEAAKRGEKVKPEPENKPEVEDTKTQEKLKLPRGWQDDLQKKFADGKWHTKEKIGKSLDIDSDMVATVIGNMKRCKKYRNNLYEDRRYRGTVQHRIIKGNGVKIDYQAFFTEVEPILEKMEDYGKRHPAESLPRAEVFAYAMEIREHFDKFAAVGKKEAKVDFGVATPENVKRILSALHPDKEPTREQKNKAFDIAKKAFRSQDND